MVTSCGNKKQLSRNAHQPLHAPCGGGGGDAGLSSPWLRQPPGISGQPEGGGSKEERDVETGLCSPLPGGPFRCGLT